MKHAVNAVRFCALCATCRAFCCCLHRHSKIFVIRRAAQCYSPFPGERSVFIRPRAQHFRCGVMPFVLLRSRPGSQGAESGWVYKHPQATPGLRQKTTCLARKDAWAHLGVFKRRPPRIRPDLVFACAK